MNQVYLKLRNEKVPDPIDTRAFEAMTTAVDKTAVSLFEPEDEKGTKGIHTALLAAGMTPAYGNIADIADATLYALEGEFGEAAWSAAAAIPVIGQMVAGRRAAKVAKEAGEEMVTLYRGVDKWHPGEMVKEGRFVGGGKYTGGKQKQDLWVTTRKQYATGKDFGKDPRRGGRILLEFEVPKSIYEKQFFRTGVHEGHALGIFQEGIPKEFLKKVHK